MLPHLYIIGRLFEDDIIGFKADMGKPSRLAVNHHLMICKLSAVYAFIPQDAIIEESIGGAVMYAQER
jgi:hypothetical protein